MNINNDTLDDQDQDQDHNVNDQDNNVNDQDQFLELFVIHVQKMMILMA